jgi:ceramide glucosyltransferase
MAVTRSRLAEIGGFEGLADCAADDHDLGCRLVARGYRVDLAPCVVETLCASSSAREYILHHVRWGVVTRHCRPWGYAALLFTRGLPWSVAAAVVAPSRAVAIGYLVAYLVTRLGMALISGAYGLKDPLLPRKWWLIPLHDVLWLFIWAATLFSNRVSWQGAEFYVRQGRFVPVPQSAKTEPKQSARAL